MEKKKGDICIVNKALFTTDDNHPAGFTIPVNTRLIIDSMNNKYFFCTLDTGYKIGIKLEDDCSLVIITDNKKINKFKQQLAENIQHQNNNITKIETEESFIKDPITVIQRKIWTVEVLTNSDGTTTMNRTNDGFNISELMGLATFLQQELIKQWQGVYPTPDIVKRTVIVD